MGKTRDLTDVLEGTGSGTQLDHILVSRDLLEKQASRNHSCMKDSTLPSSSVMIPMMQL